MEELKKRFQKAFPQTFFLSNSIPEVEAFLKQKQWLEADERILSVARPGEGNMNFVLRINTSRRSFIIKQARPWVEKYPSIAAPVERNEVEVLFLRAVSRNPILKGFSPTVMGSDPAQFVMIMEDLGEGVDYSFLYSRQHEIPAETLTEMTRYLSQLHQVSIREFPDNLAMRRLNHEHIFRFPFAEYNGLNLDDIQPGLQEASLPYKRDESLKGAISQLGDLYLAAGPVLIHGDFYPGSWLNTSGGLKIIDAEFAFRGYAEFDLGVFLAHLTMAGQNGELIERMLDSYQQAQNFNPDLMVGFAGTEILRRLLGVAQLPLSLSVKAKQDLMKRAAKWITKN